MRKIMRKMIWDFKEIFRDESNKVVPKFYPDIQSIYVYKESIELLRRLPEYYKKFLEDMAKQPSPLHFIPNPEKFRQDPRTLEIKRVENVPIPLFYPPKVDEGIWGGEAIICGYKKKHPLKPKITFFWVPRLFNEVLYSEILDKYMETIVTMTTLQLIDKHYGFDKYILETPVEDLKSQLALDLRRKMLLTLARREMYPDDPEKQEKIYQKYSKYIVPEEEAEWFGLPLYTALEKQRWIEKDLNKPVPFKIKFRQKLLENLKERSVEGGEEQSYKRILSKWNPFVKKTPDQLEPAN